MGHADILSAIKQILLILQPALKDVDRVICGDDVMTLETIQDWFNRLNMISQILQANTEIDSKDFEKNIATSNNKAEKTLSEYLMR